MVAAASTSPPPPARGLRDRLLHAALVVSAALLLWSFVGGLAYLLTLERQLPLRTDPLARARARAERGDVATALREYTTAARIDGSDLRARNEMAQLLLKQGRLAEAEAAFAAVLQVSPRDPTATQGMADLRLAQSRYREAIDLYQGLLEQRERRDPNLLNNLGIARAHSGDLAGAITAFAEAAALEPASSKFAANLAQARAERARAEAAARAPR